MAAACYESAERPKFLMIRGVSDLADEAKDTAGVQYWRRYACAVAARFAINLIRSEPLPIHIATSKPKARQTPLHESNVPLLILELVEPALPWTVPPARDQSADIQEALDREALRLGAPSRQWISKALAGRSERLRTARKILEKEVEPDRWDMEWWTRSREAADPVNPAEEYALKLYEWYGLEAHHLANQHVAQTAAARSIFLVFRVSNAGRIPAEKVTVGLSLPMDLSVDEYTAEPQELGSPPEIPVSLKEEIAAPVPNVDLKPIVWYQGWERSKPPWSKILLRPEFFRQDHDQNDVQLFRAYIPHLEHGSSKLTRPLRVNFKDRPVQSLRIPYALHATNQPSDSRGEISIEIVESATSSRA